MSCLDKLLKGEAQFSVEGPAIVKLTKLPGKNGKISCYADRWRVELWFGNKSLNLTDWSESEEATRRRYELYKSFLEAK